MSGRTIGDASSGPRQALRGLGFWFFSIGIFSVFVNLLMLTGPLYMLQVYDRVLGSRSEATLVALTLLMAGLYTIMGVLDHTRSRIAARVGTTVQARLDEQVFRIGLERAVVAGERSKAFSGLKDLEAVQRFFASPVLFAFFDAPFAPLFLAAIFLLHPLLGWFSLASIALLVMIALANRIFTRKPETEAAAASLSGDAIAESLRQHAEPVTALGMTEPMLARWRKLRKKGLHAQLKSSDRVGAFATTSKGLRFFLQSAVLGLGAFLAISGEMSGGAMIAASILLGRALAPVEQAIGGWPAVLRAREGWRRLETMLGSEPVRPALTKLPRPQASLSIEQMTIVPPEARKATLRMLSFVLEPGHALGVIGASASGKSSLARALAGLWRPASGAIRLGGAELSQYGTDLARHVGYLPQDVILFDGTVAENIACFESASDDEIVAAALKAGAHELILQLPEGYGTQVAAAGARLSGGQRQRIGLARALFRDPVLLVLDEPNAHLDAAGSDVLNAAVRQAKIDGRAVVLMSHRPTGLAECDLLLVLEDGVARAFGPRDDILKAQVRNHAQLAGRLNGEGAA